jgi:hypothetical protein
MNRLNNHRHRWVIWSGPIAGEHQVEDDALREAWQVFIQAQVGDNGAGMSFEDKEMGDI